MPVVIKDEGFWFPGYFGRFLDSLAMGVEELIVIAHIGDENDAFLADYRLTMPNVRLVYLPKKRSFPHLLLMQVRTSRLVRSIESGLDAFLVRGPTPLMPIIGESIKDKPIAFLMIGDYLSGLESSNQTTWRNRLIKLFWQHIYGRINKLARKALTIVNSERLYQQFAPYSKVLSLTHTTSISSAELYQRNDTCQQGLIRLVYTGRIVPEKGIDDLLTAIESLSDRGFLLHLDLVGWGDKDGNYQKNLVKKIRDLGLDRFVSLHGYLPVGEELYEFYRKSDIFVLASNSSFEGFPRVIWEALGHSLPVVSTDVGSIRSYVGPFVELAPVRDPEALADAIERVIKNDEKRRKNIASGFEYAKEMTLEKQTEKLLSTIKEYANKN